jgi:hypothetical protein
MFSRDKIAKAATEIADHLQLIDNVRALQQAQKEIAQTVNALSQKIWEMQSELRGLRAEVTLAAMKETQSIVNAVQGGLNERMESMAVRLAIAEREMQAAQRPGSVKPALSLPSNCFGQLGSTEN